MKNVMKKLLLIIAVVILGVCSFCYTNEVVAAEGTSEDSYLLVLNEETKEYYKANEKVGSVSGYTTQAIGSEIELVATPNEHYEVWGWVYDDGVNPRRVLTTSATIQVTYTDLNGAEQTEDISFSFRNGGKTLHISKLWQDLKIEPIFDHTRYSVEVKNINGISEWGGASGGEYDEGKYNFRYKSKIVVDATTNKYQNVLYYVGSYTYYIDEVVEIIEEVDGPEGIEYVSKLYTEEVTLEDTPRVMLVPLRAKVYHYGAKVTIADSVVASKNVEITKVEVVKNTAQGKERTSLTLNDVITTANMKVGESDPSKYVLKTTAYSIEDVVVDNNVTIEVSYRNIYTITLKIQHDGVDMANDYEFKDQINSAITLPLKKTENPNGWRQIDTNKYVIYGGASYRIIANHIQSIISNKTYEYFRASIDGAAITAKDYVANSDITHTINYISVPYNIVYKAALFTPVTDGSDNGRIVDLNDIEVPIADDKKTIIRGETITLDNDDMDGKKVVGYIFVGWLKYNGNKNNVTKTNDSSSIELELLNDKPADIVVYACFVLDTYTIKLDVGSNSLNNGSVDIYSINNSQTTVTLIEKNNNQTGRAGLGNTFDTIKKQWAVDETFVIGNKISLNLVANIGFNILGAKIDGEDVDGDLLLNQELLAKANGDNEIIISIDSEYILYTIELTSSNYSVSELLVDTEVSHSETMHDGDAYIEKITYSNLKLYDKVNLKSQNNNTSAYNFLGYYNKSLKLGGTAGEPDSYEFTINATTYRLFEDEVLGVVARYQSKTGQLLIESNKEISYTVSVYQGSLKSKDENGYYTITTDPFTVSVSDIQIGYNLSSLKLEYYDSTAGEGVDVSIEIAEVTGGYQITPTTADTRILTLTFEPIQYTVEIYALGEEEPIGTTLVDVETKVATISRPDNRYYISEVYPLNSNGHTGAKLNYAEKNNDYLTTLYDLMADEGLIDDPTASVNDSSIILPIAIKIGDGEIISLIQNMVDNKIKLAVGLSIAKHSVTVQYKATNLQGEIVSNPTIKGYYSLDRDNNYEEVTSSLDISYDNTNGTITYKMPIESDVKFVVTELDTGTEFAYWQEADNVVYKTGNSVPDYIIEKISKTHGGVILSFSLINYDIRLHTISPEAGAKPAVNNMTYTGPVHITNAFTIDGTTTDQADKPHVKYLGIKVKNIFYYRPYKAGDEVVYVIDGETGNFVLYDGEIDPEALGNYYAREYLQLSNGGTTIGSFNPADYIVDNTNGLDFYVEYEYIKISIVPYTTPNEDLEKAGVGDDFVIYKSNNLTNPMISGILTDLNISSGTITITPELQSIELPIAVGNNEVKIVVDLNIGIEIGKDILIYNKTYELNNGVLTIDIRELFSTGNVPADGGKIQINFTYQLKDTTVALTTQVGGTSFYDNINLMINGSSVNNNYANNKKFLERFQVKFAWTDTHFDETFKITRIRIKVGSNLVYDNDSDALNYFGVSTLDVTAGTNIDVLLLRSMTIEFVVEAKVLLKGVELTSDGELSKTFNYDRLKQKAVAYTQINLAGDPNNPTTRVAAEVKVNQDIWSALELTIEGSPMADKAIYAGVYIIDIGFNGSVVGYEWLKDVIVPHKIILTINPLMLSVNVRLADIGKIEINYDGTDDFLLDKYTKIYANMYFSHAGEHWLDIDEDANIRLSKTLEAKREDKSIGFKTVRLTGFTLLESEGPISNADIIRSITILTEELPLEGILNVKPREITINNYDVYDKIYDGTNIAIPKDLSKVIVMGLIKDDDVKFDVSLLEPKFNNSELSAHIGDRNVNVQLGSALTGDDAENYTYVLYRVTNRTIYPSSVELTLESGDVIKVENRQYATNPSKANLIPLGSKLAVTEIYKSDENYINFYDAIDKQINSRTSFKKGYIISLNGAPISNGLTLVLPNAQSGRTIYVVSGTDSSKATYTTEDGVYAINQFDLPNGAEVFFMIDDRSFLKPWQIILIVLGSAGVIGGTVATVIIVRKKRLMGYSKNERI